MVSGASAALSLSAPRRAAFYDPGREDGADKALGIRRVHSLGALLAEAECVSLHCLCDQRTAGIIGAMAFGAMRAGAVGPEVDAAHLGCGVASTMWVLLGSVAGFLSLGSVAGFCLGSVAGVAGFCCQRAHRADESMQILTCKNMQPRSICILPGGASTLAIEATTEPSDRTQR